MEQQNGETEFKATGITSMFKEVWTIGEKKLAGLHTPEQMYKAFVEFYKEIVNEYGKVTHCFADYRCPRTSPYLWYEQIFTAEWNTASSTRLYKR